MKRGIIYKITNLINGKIYIGQTIQKFSKRIKDYKGDYKRYNYGIHAAIRKYGFDNFKFEILHTPKIDKLDFYERYLILKLKANDREFGYNIADGGNSNRVVSEETKLKIKLTRSKLPKPNQHIKGKSLSEKHREALKVPKTLTNLQRKQNSERISLLHKGKNLKQEHKDKIAESHKKKISQFTLEDIFIKNWDSISEAALGVGVDISSLSGCLNFKQKTCAKSKWKYGTYE